MYRLFLAPMPAAATCRVIVTLAAFAFGPTACGGDDELDDESTEARGDELGAGTTSFTTYLGGAAYEQIRDVAVDGQGNIYVTGGTESTNFPTTPGVVQPAKHPGPPSNGSIQRFDVFIAKFDPSGALLKSTYLGGPNYDRAYGIEVDGAGYVYIAGRAGAGFPITAGAFQVQHQGGQSASFYGPQDGFVCKLVPDLSAVVFCSYFGATDSVIVRDLAVDANGDIFLASGHDSGSYPPGVASEFLNAKGPKSDAVIAKVKGDGSQVLWARHLGGSGKESHQNSVRLDATGNPTLLFTTESTNVPTSTNAFDRTYNGGGDVFIARFASVSGAYSWGTYLGGGGNESTETHELAVKPDGTVFVVVPTTSSAFPTTPGVVQPAYGGGGNDVLVARISSSGAQLVAATYFGGNQNDRPEGCATGPDGVYFTGTTTSANLPTTTGSTISGARDAMAVILSDDLKNLVHSRFVGGSGDEYGRGLAVDSQGTMAIGGETSSTNMTLVNPFQPALGGASDGFVSALAP